MKVVFDTQGNEKQKLAARYWIDYETSETVYGGAKGGGKSYLGCSLVLGDALMYPGTHYFIARKQLNDLRKYTIPSIHEVLNSWKVSSAYYTYNGQDNVFQFHNGSKIFLIDAGFQPSDPEYFRFGSMQMTRGWIEEAGELDVKAKNNLCATVGRWKNDVYKLHPKVLMTCNPAKNFLYPDYYKPYKKGTLPIHRKFIQAFPQDNLVLAATGYFENLQRSLSPAEKERLLYGNWEYDDDPAAMIQYDAIIDLYTNTVAKSDRLYLVADIARYGSDRSVVTIWKGLECTDIKVYRKRGVDEISRVIRDISVEKRIPYSQILVDEDGIGGGVVDTLRGIKGFVANSKPLPNQVTGALENYTNLKAQCGYTLAEIVNNHQMKISVDDAEIREDLTRELEYVKTYNADKEGKKQMIPKDKVKDILGRSPDLSDCLLMRMWFEIQPHKEADTTNFARQLPKEELFDANGMY